MTNLPPAAFTLFVVLGLSGCGYNSLQQQDEAVKTSWSQVVSLYQRRADLISSLAATVKGVAATEKELIGVAESSARSGSMPAAAAVLNDPAAFATYLAVQERLTASLQRLMSLGAVYPQLQSDDNFLDLRAQLVETEDHITSARNRYIEAARLFNSTVRSFPTDLTARIFDYQPQPILSGDK